VGKRGKVFNFGALTEEMLGFRRDACWTQVMRLIKNYACDLVKKRVRQTCERVKKWGDKRTGTETFLNIAIPFLTSDSATSCGVETITAPKADADVHQAGVTP
jgi:hypothetical protein